MARQLVAPSPYVASRITTDDMMLQPTTFDSVLESGGSTDTVGEDNLVPGDPVSKVDNLTGTPRF